MGLERWEIDRGHSGIHFSARHMVVAKVRGQFARWSATILVEDGDPTRGSAEAIIEAASIDTGVAERDGHLKSSDFLDVARYPEITFKSRRVEGLGGDHLRVVGDLTIRGVTHEVSLDVEYSGMTKDPWGHERVGLTAKTSINRRLFGLTWNQLLEAGGVVVGEHIDIEIEIEAVKQSLARAA